LNDGKGKFSNHSQGSGLDDIRYSVGVCGADYDNDGDTDLYVTNFDSANGLFNNNGTGHFTDMAVTAGVTGARGFDASCAFADIDNDGWLDLYVTYYVDHSKSNNPACRNNVRAYCGPHAFKGPKDRLFRNQGNGKFADVSERLGSYTECRSLGTLFSDLDNDGDQDIVTTCDRNPNLYFINTANGFNEIGLSAGMALALDGVAQAGMGIVSGDYDNDGRIDLAATYFVGEANGLYKNLGNNVFLQAQNSAATAHSTARNVSWGTEFLDADLDGDLDWMIANGHADYWVEGMPIKRNGIDYKLANTLMINQGGSRFKDGFAYGQSQIGSAFSIAKQSRGLATADIDNDGDIDVLITNLNDVPELYRNDTPRHKNNWLKVKTVGTKSNRDGIGARVHVVLPDATLVREIRSGQSYLSQSEMVAHFGLGREGRIPLLRIDWPSGAITELRNLKVNRQITIIEPAD
jgi:hypothetical protein